MTNSLRVVVVDDSALFRTVLCRALSALGGVEVVGQASNGAEAVELVRQQAPDLLTLDLNMPVMDGLQTLRCLREQKLRCEVIVVSSETKQGAIATFEALQAGAVDFITKPAEDSARSSSEVLSEQLRRQLAAIRLRRESLRKREQRSAGVVASAAQIPSVSGSLPTISQRKGGPVDIVVLGASTGGPSALPLLLAGLPAELPTAILVVQHMPPLFTASFAESLGRKSALRVVEAVNGQLIDKGTVYIAPGGKHMKVKRGLDQTVRVVVTDDAPENHCRPSVDVLFRSVAQEYGGRVLAAILTGMGNDGVAGMKLLKGLGAVTLAQDEATCTVFGMPQEAIRAGIVDKVLALDRIAPAIIETLRQNGT